MSTDTPNADRDPIRPHTVSAAAARAILVEQFRDAGVEVLAERPAAGAPTPADLRNLSDGRPVDVGAVVNRHPHLFAVWIEPDPSGTAWTPRPYVHRTTDTVLAGAGVYLEPATTAQADTEDERR